MRVKIAKFDELCKGSNIKYDATVAGSIFGKQNDLLAFTLKLSLITTPMFVT